MQIRDAKGILIDSNELIYAFKNKVDLLRLLQEAMIPIKLYTLRANVNEIKSKGINIEDWLKNQQINIIEVYNKKTDELILEEAKKRNLCIFTEDQNLAKEAKNNGIIAIKLKNQRSIEFY